MNNITNHVPQPVSFKTTDDMIGFDSKEKTFACKNAKQWMDTRIIKYNSLTEKPSLMVRGLLDKWECQDIASDINYLNDVDQSIVSTVNSIIPSFGSIIHRNRPIITLTLKTLKRGSNFVF